MVPPSAGAVAARPDAYTTVPISVANNSLLFSLLLIYRAFSIWACPAPELEYGTVLAAF
jgi:hypothetical protein